MPRRQAWLAFERITTLAGLLIGLPIGLGLYYGQPLPTRLPRSTAEFVHVMARGVPWERATVLAGWGLWLVVVVTVTLEIRAHRQGRQAKALAGCQRLQRWVAETVVATSLLAGARPAFTAPALAETTAVTQPAPPAQLAGAFAPGHRQVVALAGYRAVRVQLAGGPTALAEPLAELSSSPGAETELPTITVRERDTLWDLAARHCPPFGLRGALRSEEIWQLNAGRLFTDSDGVTRRFTDKNLIFPGWVLRLPADAAVNSSQPVVDQVSPTVPPSPTEPAPGVPSPGSTPSVPSSTSGPAISPKTAPAVEPAPGVRHVLDAEEAAAEAVGIGAAELCLAGVWVGVRRLRRRRSAQLPLGWQLAPRPPEVRRAATAADEAAGDTVTRLDLALRALRVGLQDRPVGHAPQLRAVLIDRAGVVEVVWAGADDHPPPPWTMTDNGRWRLAAEVLVRLEEHELVAPSPCPALVTLGDSPTGTVLVNLEVVGGAQLTGPNVVSVARRWATELATAPWGHGCRVVTAPGLITEALSRLEATESHDDWTARVRAAADFGAATQGGAGEPLAAGRMCARVGDELLVAIDHKGGVPIGSSPGLVVIGPAVPTGVVIDTDLGQVELDGVGPVTLAGPDDTAVDAALAAADPPPAMVEPITDPEPPAPPSAAAPTGDTSHADDGRPALEEPIAASSAQQDAASSEHDVSAAQVRIELLGRPRITGVGPPPPDRGPQLVDMAAVLALHPNGIPRAELVSAVWGAKPLSETTFTSRLANLRSWLGGGDALPELDGMLRLGDQICCDYREFRRLAASPTGRQEALRMVRGVPLEGGLHHWDDRDERQQRIIGTVIGAALPTAREQLAAGRAAESLEAAEAARRACPWDQQTTRATMRALAALGDFDRIYDVVAEAETWLEEGEPLEPETTALLEELTSSPEARRRARPDRRPESANGSQPKPQPPAPTGIDDEPATNGNQPDARSNGQPRPDLETTQPDDR